MNRGIAGRREDRNGKFSPVLVGFGGAGGRSGLRFAQEEDRRGGAGEDDQDHQEGVVVAHCRRLPHDGAIEDANGDLLRLNLGEAV